MKIKAMLGALAMAAAVGLLATAAADPISTTSGKVNLPTSGLVIDVPAKAGITYRVSASWSLTEEGVFDTRDVIDEFSGADIVAGNWVLIGYFDAGSCDKVLASETLDKSWTMATQLWGAAWTVRGGIYTFTGALGRKPAALLCRDSKDGRTLLLYRFLLTQPETVTQDAVLADLRGASVLERASRAYDAGGVELVQPLKRPEVTNRGKVAAVRQIKLSQTRLALDLPDDGYVWISNPNGDADSIERMAPFFPQVSLDVAAIDNATCDEVFQSVTQGAEKKPGAEARNLPTGWRAGPAIIYNGAVEAITCRAASYGSLAVGMFLGGDRTDASDLGPILTALAAAKRTP